MNPRQYARWGKTRRKGRRYYVFLYGVLGWGLTFGFVNIFLYSFLFKLGFWEHFLVYLLLLFFSLVGGYAFGCITWRIGESMYCRYLTEKREENGGEGAGSPGQ